MGTGINWIETLRTSPTLMAILGFSVVSLAIALERTYYYWKRGGNPDSTMEQVVRSIRKGDIREAVRICRSSRHPMGPVAAQLIEKGAFKEEEAEEQIQIGLSEQKLLLERNLGILGTTAAVGPLLGLLGTVWGIMRAFTDMSATGSGSPSVVAAGVAEALITTAVGIMIAVPSLILYNVFVRRMNVMLTVAENNVRSLRSILASETDRDPDARETHERRPRAVENKAERMVDELDLVR